MALLKKTEFEELAKTKGKYCISIYIPTYRGGENKDSLIRLKNETANVEKELAKLGLKPKEIKEYLAPIKGLINDSNLWRLLSDALVVFRSPDKFEYFTLPLDVEEFSHVSDRFYLLPVLRIFNQDNVFFILSISLNQNRLYEATQHEITEIEVDDIFPNTYRDTVGHDVVQKSLDFRSRMPGAEYAPFHGKGGGKDYKSKEIIKYLEDVDRRLNELLQGYEIPLVVAAVEELFSHFKKISSYKNLYPECVPGNYDNNDILLIHEKALDVLKPYFNRVKNEKKKLYEEAIGKTTSSVEDVVISADAGQIDTLFIARGKKIWGRYNRKAGKIDVHEKKEELDNSLLELAARKTFSKGGQVFIENQENLPEKSAPVNAILRF